MRLFLKHAFDKVCVKRSIKIALIVGTILALINHFDSIIYGTLTKINIFQIILTYFVPYAVATVGAAMHGRHIELKGIK